jgi:hypothetical protein
MERRKLLGLIAILLVSIGTPMLLAADGDVRIRLAGPGGKGSAKYRSRGGVREFQVEAENLRLPAGTVLTVTANGLPAGTMNVALGAARLNLNTQRGNAVPVIAAGSVVTVIAPNGVVLMSGRF